MSYSNHPKFVLNYNQYGRHFPYLINEWAIIKGKWESRPIATYETLGEAVEDLRKLGKIPLLGVGFNFEQIDNTSKVQNGQAQQR